MRESPYEPLELCNQCGELRKCYNYGGEWLCSKCIDELDEDYSNEETEDNEDE